MPDRVETSQCSYDHCSTTLPSVKYAIENDTLAAILQAYSLDPPWSGAHGVCYHVSPSFPQSVRACTMYAAGRTPFFVMFDSIFIGLHSCVAVDGSELAMCKGRFSS